MKNTGDKTLKFLNKLNEENNDLRRAIDDYKEAEKVRWENFKTSLDHDINTIEIELKDVNNQIK